MPIIPPRESETRRTNDGWRFRFLNRAEGCGPTIDWQMPGAAPADQLWAMNLHYFEHSENLADADWSDLVRQWVAANPPYAPGSARAGWNAYAISLRVVSWLQQSAVRRDRVDPETLALATASAAAQLRFLERHLETDIGGNHLIKNIAALLWGSAALDSPRSGRWRRLGLRLLSRELGQLLPDGMHFERSSSYHAQVVADLVNIRRALGHDPLGGRLDQAIVRGLQAGVDLAHPDGLASLFGDSGLHMAIPPADLLAAAAELLKIEAVPRSSFAYPDAGYFGIRDGADLLIVDAGPLGPDSLPGHAHGDMFAFEWSVAGERVIVDQGVFEYVGGERRHASRTARNHNTVAAPGADQADFYGAFRLGRRARLAGRTAEFDSARLVLRAGHDGFVGPPSWITHEREIDATTRIILVRDRLSAPLDGASASLLLAPQARPVTVAERSVRIDGFSVPITLTAQAAITIEPAVWWPDMGVEIPSCRLRIAIAGSEGAFELNAGEPG